MQETVDGDFQSVVRTLPAARQETGKEGGAMGTAEGFHYVFTSLRGIQAGREYYVVMCPLRLLPKIFLFDEEEVAPEIRAQRTLNRARVPELARYLVENPKGYVFSSITASVDGLVKFEPLAGEQPNVGTLTVPMSTKFVINDGQHRRAGIEEALKERPEIADETISVVFFVDAGLKRSQQMFADLNRYAVRPTRSIGVFYDHRDALSQLACRLAKEVPVFKGVTEFEKTTISNRSRKLFTLSSIYLATRRLLRKGKHAEITAPEEALAREFWTEVGKHMPDWQAAAEHRIAAAELRRDFIHAHGLALQALAVVGAELIAADPVKWKAALRPLSRVDWSRSNAAVWEGRATIGGRVNKAEANVQLTANVIKDALGVSLSPAGRKMEARHGRAQRSA